MNTQILERLRETKNLPTLPAVATQIIQLCQQEDSNLSELCQLVSQDPALSSKVLKTVNSAHYGFAREIATINHAVAILGIDVMQTVALTFSLLLGLRHGERDGSVLKAFWRRSLISAVAARCLGTRMHRRDQEVLFLAALLQDVGMLALREAFPRQYPTLLAQSRGEHWVLTGLENAELGMDHAAVSAWLMSHWQLPTVYESTIKASHTPESADLDSPYHQPSQIVALSGLIADIWLMKDPFSTTQCAMGNASRLLGMGEEDMRDLLKHIAQTLPELSVLYEMDLGDSESVGQVLEQLEEAGGVPARDSMFQPELNGVELPCTVQWGSESRSGLISNLSYGGALVKKADEVPPEDSTVYLGLATAQETVRLEARITWRVTHEQNQLQDQLGAGSFGVQFSDTVDDLRVKLNPVFSALTCQQGNRISA